MQIGMMKILPEHPHDLCVQATNCNPGDCEGSTDSNGVPCREAFVSLQAVCLRQVEPLHMEGSLLARERQISNERQVLCNYSRLSQFEEKVWVPVDDKSGMAVSVQRWLG